MQGGELMTPGQQIIALLREQCPGGYVGKDVHNLFLPSERYVIDFDQELKHWQQYDTSQDAPYFGTWVCIPTREVLSYAEGDWSLTKCHDAQSFRETLATMAECYGEAPPAFRCFSADGSVTHIYTDRPEAPSDDTST